MDVKTFKKNDDSFICVNCLREVPKLNYTSRDHCPYCLYSMHVDINPGDRLCNCHGILKPVEVCKDKKGLYKIIYKCMKCNASKRNIQAQDDDINEIIKISVGR